MSITKTREVFSLPNVHYALNYRKTVAGLRTKKVWQKLICHTFYFIYVSLRLAYFALISLIKRSACPHLSII